MIELPGGNLSGARPLLASTEGQEEFLQQTHILLICRSSALIWPFQTYFLLRSLSFYISNSWEGNAGSNFYFHINATAISF